MEAADWRIFVCPLWDGVPPPGSARMRPQCAPILPYPPTLARHLLLLPSLVMILLRPLVIRHTELVYLSLVRVAVGCTTAAGGYRCSPLPLLTCRS